MRYSGSEPMEKIVIGSQEVAQVTVPPPDQPSHLEPKLADPVPMWARIAMCPLVLVLPVLCLFTIVLRFAMRGLPPRTRFTWISFLSTLLTIDGHGRFPGIEAAGCGDQPGPADMVLSQ